MWPEAGYAYEYGPSLEGPFFVSTGAPAAAATVPSTKVQAPAKEQAETKLMPRRRP